MKRKSIFYATMLLVIHYFLLFTVSNIFAACTAPSGLTASKGTYTNKIALSWNGVSGTTCYAICRNTTGVTPTFGQPGDGYIGSVCNTTTYDDTNVSNGTTYYYWVLVETPTFCSTGSNRACGFLKPSAPSGLSASQGTYTNKISLSWNSVSGVSCYDLCRNTTGITPNFGSPGDGWIGTVCGTSHDDSNGLSTGVTYYYWVVSRMTCDGVTAISSGSNRATGYLYNTPNPDDTDDDSDGYSENQGDCNDSDSSIHPGALEICNDGVDNDCDGDVDEGCSVEEDDHGDSCPTATTVNVNSTRNGVLTSDDHDYFRIPVYSPGTLTVYTESDIDTFGYLKNSSCIDIVNNDDSLRNGNIDRDFKIIQDVEERIYYVDVKGYTGDITGPYTLHVEFTAEGSEDNDNDGYTGNDGDCDDNDSSIHPGAQEICGDGIDNDCDGNIDEGCCTDTDNDGYYAQAGCGSQIDCNDNNANVHPGAAEVYANGIDNDCDGLIDEDSPVDNDNDGYTGNDGDCDDNNSSIHPGAQEICGDGIDNDCDGNIDEGCPVDDDDDTDVKKSSGGGGGGCFIDSVFVR